LLEQADSAFARARAVGGGSAGTFRLGVSPAVSADEVNAVINIVQARGYSAVTVSDVRPGRITRALADGTFYLVLARTVAPRHASGLQRLTAVPVGVALNAGHRLAPRARARWSDLDYENLLVWNAPGTPYTDLLLALAARHGARLTPVRSTVIGGRGLPDVAKGRGIALVAAFQTDTTGVRVLPLEPTDTLPLLAAWSTVHDSTLNTDHNHPLGPFTASERKRLVRMLTKAAPTGGT
jgi:DNA-binding transcriptional LysR family regulator